MGTGLVEFGARRALFDTPEALRSNSGAFVFGVATLVRAMSAKPRADIEGRRLVCGRRSLAFSDIDFAQLEVGPSPLAEDIGIRFGLSHGPQVVVGLRTGDIFLQTPEHRRIVLMMLGDSQIRMPVSPYDPTGAHARWNFPTNMTKAQAIEVVSNPPGLRDPLPIPPVR